MDFIFKVNTSSETFPAAVQNRSWDTGFNLRKNLDDKALFNISRSCTVNMEYFAMDSTLKRISYKEIIKVLQEEGNIQIIPFCEGYITENKMEAFNISLWMFKSIGTRDVLLPAQICYNLSAIVCYNPDGPDNLFSDSKGKVTKNIFTAKQNKRTNKKSVKEEYTNDDIKRKIIEKNIYKEIYMHGKI